MYVCKTEMSAKISKKSKLHPKPQGPSSRYESRCSGFHSYVTQVGDVASTTPERLPAMQVPIKLGGLVAHQNLQAWTWIQTGDSQHSTLIIMA